MNERRLYTFNEVKDYLQIGKNTLLDLLHTKEIDGFKVAGKWRVASVDLIKYEENQKRKAKAS